MKEYYTI